MFATSTNAVIILGGLPATGLRQWTAYQWLINVRCVEPFNKDRQTCRLGCGQRFAFHFERSSAEFRDDAKGAPHETSTQGISVSGSGLPRSPLSRTSQGRRP